MKIVPYPYRNQPANRSCLFCNKVGNGVNKHFAHARSFERWLVQARKEAGLGIRSEETRHLIN